MASGSLVVKISADINSFTSQLQKATKDVSKAADSLASVGKKMSLAITLPVGLALGALAKMGMENEAVSRRMSRVFGSATQQMEGHLKNLAQLVPEAGTELEKFAIHANDIGEGLGMASPQAAKFADGAMQIAAAVSAANMVPFGEALEAVEKGLMGQTRGLKEYGIVLDNSAIKQEAYRLGLLKSHQELTPLGTALASYSLLSKQAARFQGEAADQAQDAGRQWEFLKRDFAEFADATSNLLLPALTALVSAGRTVVDWLNAIPMPLRGTILAVAAFAAILGPTIFAVARFTQALVELQAAVKILEASGGIASVLAFLAQPEVLAGIVAIGLLIGGLTMLWQKYHKTVEKKPTIPKLDLPNVAGLMGGDGKTGAYAGDPVANWRRGPDALMRGMQLAIEAGHPLLDGHERMRDLATEALGVYSRQADKFGEMALAAREIAIQAQRAASVEYIATSQGRANFNVSTAVRAGSMAEVSNATLARQAVSQLIGNETSLRLRELAVSMTDNFNAARVAALQLAEGFRESANRFKTQVATFKQSWSSASNIGSGLMQGLQQGAGEFMASMGPAALAAAGFSKVMEGLQPVLDAVMEPLVELGKIIGIMLTPILKVLFIPLKAFGIATAFLGEILARVSGGIATAIGKLLVGIGNLLNKLPGSIGNPIKKAGEGILSFADSQYEAADQLKRARQELQKMQFGDTADALGNLKDAAQSAAEQLTNLPSAFKIALRRYQSTDPINGANQPGGPLGGSDPGQWGNGTPSLPGGLGGILGGAMNDRAPAIALQVDGKTLANITWGHIRLAASMQFGSPMRVADVSTVR